MLKEVTHASERALQVFQHYFQLPSVAHHKDKRPGVKGDDRVPVRMTNRVRNPPPYAAWFITVYPTVNVGFATLKN